MMNTKRRKVFGISNKKGDILDGFYIAIFALVVGIVLVIVAIMYDGIGEKISGPDSPVSNSSASLMTEEMGRKHGTVYDAMFAITFGLMMIGVVLTAFFIDSHPAFFGILCIIFVFLVIIAIALGTVWDDIAKDDIFGEYLYRYPMTNHIVGNIGMYVVITIISVMAVMFSKLRGT